MKIELIVQTCMTKTFIHGDFSSPVFGPSKDWGGNLTNDWKQLSVCSSDLSFISSKVSLVQIKGPISNKDLLNSTGSSAQCYVATEWEWGLWENGHMYMYGSVPLLSSWNCHNIVIAYIPTQNLKKIKGSQLSTDASLLLSPFPRKKLVCQELHHS